MSIKTITVDGKLHRGRYAEGVTFHSPGSRACERTLGQSNKKADTPKVLHTRGAVFGSVLLLCFSGCFSSSPKAPPAESTANTTAQEATDASAPSNQLDLLPSSKERTYDAAIRDIIVREDPEVDGWKTEKFNELADKQLKQVGKLLCDKSLIDTAHARDVVAPSFDGELRPQSLEPVFDDESVQVRRSTQRSRDAAQGIEGFVKAAKHQADCLGSGERRFKFKTIRVQLEASKATTRSFFQLASLGKDRVQVNATWDCEWNLDGESPKLSTVSVSNYEEVHAKARSKDVPEFADVTRSLFEGNASLDQQFVHGRDHWYANLEGSIGVEGRGNGIAIGDVNGDGLDDVYVCQPAALPNRLFVRQPDGSLKDTSVEAGVDWLDSSRGALFVDLDNDGDQDLVVTQSSQVLLHENNGAGEFQLKNSIPTVSRLFSVNAIDYDNDRDLDLYVCGYSGAQQIRPEDIFASPVPYHDANNGAPNLLLQNEGNWSFRDVTQPMGLDANNLRVSLASFWDDFDNDGDLDVYVANDFGRNNLYRNDGSRFIDIAGTAGVEDIGPGMSACSGDFNNDGKTDIYVSNMFSSAGSRIPHNSQFKPNADGEDLIGFKRHARGNSLFQNRGDSSFDDTSIASATMMGRWAWGSLMVDINNDGWRDAYVTNGFVTADNNNDL